MEEKVREEGLSNNETEESNSPASAPTQDEESLALLRELSSSGLIDL